MIRLLSLLLLSMLLLPASAAASPLSGSAACRGTVFDPVSDPNWNNMFPVTVAGMSVGGGSNPPLMNMDPVCMCPGPMGVPTPGIGMTYWEPTYVAEIARTPGCLSTLGGEQVLSGYEQQTSNQSYGSGGDRGSVTRMQVHWYVYPLFSVLDMMSTLGCLNTSGFNLADLTEVDDAWQDDTWSSVAFPEAALFANTAGILSCTPDAVASAAGRPLDSQFWCQGSQGVVYPLTGSSPHHSSPQGGNLHVLGKYMQRKTRMAGLLATIGPWAQCSSTWLPNWIRSQYRIDPIAPVASNETAVLGQSEFRWGLAPPANTSVRTDSAFLIWVGKQCCAL